MAAAPTTLRLKENDNSTKNNSEPKTEDLSANSLDYPRRTVPPSCSSGARAQRRDVNPGPHRAHERGEIGAGANNSGSDDTDEGDATSSMYRLAGSKVRKVLELLV